MRCSPCPPSYEPTNDHTTLNGGLNSDKMSHHCLHSYMERTVQEKRSYDSHDPLLSDKSHGPEGSEDEVVEVAKHNHTIWGKHRASTDWNNRYYTSRMIIGSIIVSTSALVALYCISSRALTPSYFKGQSTEVKPVVASADIDLWCGKPYKHGSPTVSVGGQFPVPTRSSQPLLHFKCWPGIQPFVEGEDSVGSVILDANIGHEIGTPIESFRPNDRLLVDIKISGSDDDESLRGLKLLSGTTLPVNSSGTTPTFELGISLKPRAEPYRLECTALNPRTLQKFSTSSSLQYLPPNPYGGSVVKTDLRTGGLLVKPLDKDIKTAQYEPFFPYGFYTGFGGYIEHDLSKLDHIKAKGYNLVHLVPPFDGVEPALDKMAELGIWFIYSMRWSFQNMTSVEQQVMAIRSRPNLLLWYTSDEPDGWNYALDAPKLAAEKIKELDGGVDRGYHPVSVVLNCEDYWFKECYTEKSDVVFHDTYPVGINPTHSIVYDTECTRTYGDCGCDNCIGDVGYDISTRVTQFRDRARWLGKERTLSVWTVPQAFGAEAFWPRKPSGKEFVIQALVAVMHGSLGINPWLYPTTDEIDDAASRLGSAMPKLALFIHSPGTQHAVWTPLPTVYVGCFASGQGVMIMAINTGPERVHTTTPTRRVCDSRFGETIFESGDGNSIKREDDNIVIELDTFGVLAVF